MGSLAVRPRPAVLFVVERFVFCAAAQTMEREDPAQQRMIDDVEVGRPVTPRLRLAFEVDDVIAHLRGGTRLMLNGLTALLKARPTATRYPPISATTTETLSRAPRDNASSTS